MAPPPRRPGVARWQENVEPFDLQTKQAFWLAVVKEEVAEVERFFREHPAQCMLETEKQHL